MRQDISNYTKKQAALCEKNNAIGKKLYSEFGVKKGSQDEKGQGVLTGLTNISQVTSFWNVDGQKIPCEGELLYRGYDIRELVRAEKEKKFIFEEGAYF